VAGAQRNHRWPHGPFGSELGESASDLPSLGRRQQPSAIFNVIVFGRKLSLRDFV
jgi:hypothetical protein